MLTIVSTTKTKNKAPNLAEPRKQGAYKNKNICQYGNQ
nr:MAG: hypothetical protein [Microvirus sp.]